ncbi:ribosome biogenesis GTP-binding protein YihA/YsxC [soil metagenome]
MTPPLPLDFLMSAGDVRALPDSPAELAVVGRSNVGKSSLLNALGRRKVVARVSKTPGRTRMLNCFEMDDATVVDCPGYGYAAVPARVRDSWQQMMEEYLLTRKPLVMILVLVDGEVGPTKLDVQMLDWLRANGRAHTVVATKHDKVKSAQSAKRKGELADGCGLSSSDIVWVSATAGTGVDRLRSLVRGWLTPPRPAPQGRSG